MQRVVPQRTPMIFNVLQGPYILFTHDVNEDRQGAWLHGGSAVVQM